MKLSAKQAIVMFEILKSSLQEKGHVAGYDRATRLNLFNQILNQQDTKLIDLGEVKTE